jgi:phosphopantetheinyl transferase
MQQQKTSQAVPERMGEPAISVGERAAVHLFFGQVPVGLAPQQRRQAGRQWLAEKLSLVAGHPVTLADITYSANGKPAVGGLPWGFSYCSSGRQVALAVTPGTGADTPAIGLDMERVEPQKQRLKLARRYFAADELAALDSLPGPNQTLGFYALWTAKEARTKYAGGRLWQTLRQSIREESNGHPFWLYHSGEQMMLCLWLAEPLSALRIHDPQSPETEYRPWTWD